MHGDSSSSDESSDEEDLDLLFLDAAFENSQKFENRLNIADLNAVQCEEMCSGCALCAAFEPSQMHSFWTQFIISVFFLLVLQLLYISFVGAYILLIDIIQYTLLLCRILDKNIQNKSEF